MQLVGDPAGAAQVEIDGNDDEFRVRYCDESGLVRATLLANRPEDVGAARRELAAAA